MRDWLTAFRPASFRGVGFFVDTEGEGGGRRVAISPIAYSERHVTEDFGAKERRIQLTAYVAGDSADRAARSFAAALQAPGPGTIVLPMGGPLSVRVLTWWRSRERVRAGYVGFDIEFVSTGASASPFAMVPAALQISGLISTALDLFRTATEFRLRDAGAGRQSSLSAAAKSAASSLESLASESGVSGLHRADVTSLARQIGFLADDPSENGGSITGILSAATSVIVDRGDASLAISAFSAAIPAGLDPFSLSAAGLFAAGVCHGLAASDYRSRQDARAARARIAEFADPVTERLGLLLSADTARWLEGVASIAADDLSTVAANRAPVVRVETGQSMPATALAHALYGDAGRAGELVKRNRVSTPAAMPVTLEALAP